MGKKLVSAAMIAAGVGLTAVGASASNIVFLQDFGADTAGIFDGNSGWHGTIERVPSGTGGVTSRSAGHHAVASMQGPTQTNTGPFTAFDGYRSAWPGGYTASVDVFLDTSWSAGAGFDYSVASSRQTGDHLRDFIFHVGVGGDGTLRVGGSNNSNFQTRMDLANINSFQVAESGWYTLQHVFYELGGSLGVDLNLLDANGNTLWTETRNNPADDIATIVGGNRYGWFTHISGLGDGLNIDNVSLAVIPLPTGAGLASLGLGLVALRRRR